LYKGREWVMGGGGSGGGERYYSGVYLNLITQEYSMWGGGEGERIPYQKVTITVECDTLYAVPVADQSA